MASVSDASTAFQSVTYWPMNCCTPERHRLVASPGARISGNQRSFQIGTMVNTATVAIAGRTSGSTRRKKIVYSVRPSMRAAPQVAGDPLHELGQDEDGERQALRRVDQDQRRQRVDQAAADHQSQDAPPCRAGSAP